MLIQDWNSFYEQAEALYRNDPLKTRYVLKYIHKSGKLQLKVTDDRVCLQYQTDQQSDVKKVEKLNNLFFGLMATGVEDSEEPAADGDVSIADAQEGAQPGSDHVSSNSNSHKRQDVPQQPRSKQRSTKMRRTGV
ncbi:g7980 [Coccomyxa viridis]|uniref:G7980 protein n=1 Tax=Coccomyxa viridis TaxID=1274662 RepID=A0ABP1G5Z1_9CHLO